MFRLSLNIFCAPFLNTSFAHFMVSGGGGAWFEACRQGSSGSLVPSGVFSFHIWPGILSSRARIGGFHLPAPVSISGFSFGGSLVQMYWLSPASCLPFVPMLDDTDCSLSACHFLPTASPQKSTTVMSKWRCRGAIVLLCLWIK